jgi:hypothetical protein
MRLHPFSLPSAVALVLATACASAPPATVAAPAWAFATATPSAGKELRLRTETRYIQVSIDGDSIFGPNWNLKHGGTYIRGEGGPHQAVQITLKGTHAEGNARNAPLTVDLIPQADGVTQVTGLFGGILSDFKISPTLFQGKLGPCSYDMALRNGRYEGMASCGGRTVNGASLELPVAMASWPDLEVAVVLAIVLGT